MKNYPALLSLLAICLSLYSCKKDKEPVPNVSDVYLTKLAFYSNGNYSGTMLMTYDNNKRLTKIMEGADIGTFSYNSDGTLSRAQRGNNYYYEFHYLDGVLQYRTTFEIMDQTTGNDTLFYKIGSNGLVDSVTFYDQLFIYTYDSNNFLKMYETQFKEYSEYYAGDTTLYEWNAQGNLVKETLHALGGSKVTTYTYDNTPNYFGAMHFPWQYPFITYDFETYKRSVNNCIQITNTHSGQIYNHNFSILELNSWGFPSKISDNGGNLMQFEYNTY